MIMRNILISAPTTRFFRYYLHECRESRFDFISNIKLLKGDSPLFIRFDESSFRHNVLKSLVSRIRRLEINTANLVFSKNLI